MYLQSQCKVIVFIVILAFEAFYSGDTFCQNQYLQNWAIHTDTSNDYISTQHLHLNEFAQSLIAISTQSDSIDLYKTDSSGSLQWRKKYHVGSFENRISGKIASDANFNYYLTIRTQQGSTRLMKLDSAGNILLNIPDTINDYLFTFPLWSYPISSLVDFDSNFIYIAKRFHYSTPNVYYITKYDHQFNPVWTRKLSSAYYNSTYYMSLDHNGYFHAMVDTFEQGGDTLRGFRLSFDSNGDTLAYHNLWKHKFMNTHWSSTIDGTGRALLTLRYDTATWTNTPPSLIIARFDTAGLIMWSDTVISTLTQGEDPAAVYGDDLGNAYLLSYQTYNPSNIIAKRRINLRKYNPNGQLIWFRFWEGNDSTNFLLRQPSLKYFDEDNIFVSGTVVNTGSYYDALIAKTDSAGNYLWRSDFSATDSLGESFSMVERDLCNNIYVLGNTDSLTANGKYLRLVKYNTEIPCLTSTIESQANKPTFLIYPNPSSEKFILRFDKPLDKTLIQIFDLPGRILFETTCDNTNILNLTLNVIPGIYIVKVEGIGIQRILIR